MTFKLIVALFMYLPRETLGVFWLRKEMLIKEKALFYVPCSGESGEQKC